jgi:hypothetical protein
MPTLSNGKSCPGEKVQNQQALLTADAETLLV